MKKLYLTIVLSSLSLLLISQGYIPPQFKTKTSKCWYKWTGFGFNPKKITLHKEDIRINEFYHEAVKYNSPNSTIGIPFVGEYHFRNYSFADQSKNLLKYNYFLFNADIRPSFYLFNTSKDRANLRLEATVQLRMWNNGRAPLRSTFDWEPSAAIKTPSYKPSITYSRRLHHNKYMINDTTVCEKYKYIELGFTHHSNGQDAPTLNSQDPTLLLDPSIKYNINDGDFSTNFIILKYNALKYVDNKSYIFSCPYIKWDGINANDFVKGDINKYTIGYNLRIIRIEKQLGAKRDNTLERDRFDFQLSYGIPSFSEFGIKRNLSCSFEYNVRFPNSPNVSLFARVGYLGQDDYNIFLENSFFYLRFGISAAYLKFVLKNRK